MDDLSIQRVEPETCWNLTNLISNDQEVTGCSGIRRNAKHLETGFCLMFVARCPTKLSQIFRSEYREDTHHLDVLLLFTLLRQKHSNPIDVQKLHGLDGIFAIKERSGLGSSFLNVPHLLCISPSKRPFEVHTTAIASCYTTPFYTYYIYTILQYYSIHQYPALYQTHRMHGHSLKLVHDMLPN